jgi:TonB family protein
MRRWSAYGFLVMGLLATGAATAATAPQPWVHRPSSDELRAALPAAVRDADLGGRAGMRCKLTAERKLAGCRLLAESPTGQGYGAALLSLASAYQMSPEAAKDRAADGEVAVVESWFGFDTPPSWKRMPSASALLGVWPTPALSRGLGGTALIDCVVNIQGVLTDCVTLSESPPGEHFGDAAIALTPQLLMNPALRHGQPTPSTATIPINFARGRAGTIDPETTRTTVSASAAWLQAPSIADVAAAYPAKARAARLGGRTILTCELRRSGELKACATLAEEPRGKGFALAALALAKQFRGVAHPEPEVEIIQLPFTFDPAMLGARPVIGRPQWVTLPSGEATGRAFQNLKIDGAAVRVVMSCTVQPLGTLGGCTVASETPPGSGLGAAALSLTPSFRVSTWTLEGLPTVGGVIRVPLRYEVDPTPAAASGRAAAKP